ncbi:MAG: ribosome silencing factor [Lentisphaerae bacterium]|nr:ribosome silencing factor [Lentisphaerota bacterium]NLV49779.1 ribosome silencing factor [Clostridiales bacterium]
MELAIKALDSKKARNIKVLRTSALTILADYFIICTATSTPHIRTLSDEASKILTEAGEPVPRIEGYRGGGWVLMDFGSVIIHLFLNDIRKFYDIEGLWSDAAEVDIASLLTQD